MTEDEVAKIIVDASYSIHTGLGPGLLESVYEACLCHELARRGIPFRRQVAVPIIYDGVRLATDLRLDLLVGERVIVELKATEAMDPVFEAQLLTYLKVANLRLGYVINFGMTRLKNGLARRVR